MEFINQIARYSCSYLKQQQKHWKTLAYLVDTTAPNVKLIAGWFNLEARALWLFWSTSFWRTSSIHHNVVELLAILFIKETALIINFGHRNVISCYEHCMDLIQLTPLMEKQLDALELWCLFSMIYLQKLLGRSALVLQVSSVSL